MGGGEIKVGPNFVLGSRYAKRAIKKVLDANSKKIFPLTCTAFIRHKTNGRKLKVVIINKALILFQP